MIARSFLTCVIALSLSCSVLATEIEIITGDHIPALGPYVPATVPGNVVYTSGQIAFDAQAGKIVGDDIRTQTRQALKNLNAVLEAAGSSLEHTLRVTVYLQNPEDFPAMNEVYQEVFGKHKPARTTVPGVQWGKGVLVEIDAIALRSGQDNNDDGT